ncbi:polyketide cyclase/dehydrase/lipid transport protein [Flavobacteriaceae bacterium MAR_2010_72]|nr:polyketide cyclase/dehydrase/lipid transport protein [Flavobacteriaceae bacterium MAR_2010_72]TVZ59349.1 polyketide cyclase/dehydrase/lipid transport protein [Flavobacteriaceae bacterium MAR_2010_105]
MMIILYIILGLAILVAIPAYVAPKSYDVSRSIEINRPLEDVFDYLKYIKNQNDWSPWKQKDPNMKQEFLGTDGEVGFISKWEGNKNVGTGEQEITQIIPNKRIDTELRFLKPWKSASNGYLITSDLGNNSTKVEWGFSGNNPVPFNIFMLFFNFEKAVGKDFEEGLTSLKEVLEH